MNEFLQRLKQRKLVQWSLAYAAAALRLAPGNRHYTLGHERESQQLMAELKEKYAVGFAYQIAQASAGRGDKDSAFEWLKHAYEQHDAGL